jgi:hypothetical protein
MLAEKEKKQHSDKFASPYQSGEKSPSYSQSTAQPLDSLQILQRSLGNQYLNSSSLIGGQSDSLLIQRACACGSSCASCGLQEDNQQIIQSKLMVGAPDDDYEQEADRVADQIMQMPDPVIMTELQPIPSLVVQRLNYQQVEEKLHRQYEVVPEDEEEKTLEIQTKMRPGTPIDSVSLAPEARLQRQPMVMMEEEEEEENEKTGMLQAKTLEGFVAQPIGLVTRTVLPRQYEDGKELLRVENTGKTIQAKGQRSQVTPSLEARLGASQGQGEPLSEETQTFMESRFGQDFSQVRIHADSDAVRMNRELGAQAFTHGQDVYFGAGKYSPESREGKRLLAHELTHVVQQRGEVQNITSTQRLCSECEAQHVPVKPHLHKSIIQGAWNSPTDSSRQWTDQHVDPSGRFWTLLGRYHRARVDYARFRTKGVQGRVETRQLPQDITRGGTASLKMWKYTRYTFNHQGSDNNILELTISGNLSGQAKAEDCHYARAGAAIFGLLKIRTPSNRSPAGTPVFPTSGRGRGSEGGESACTRVPGGEFEVIIPINGGQARLRIPLTYHREGQLADFSRSVPFVTHDVSGISDGWPIVEVYLGASLEIAADIESGIADIAWDRNWARATADYNLSWREIVLPPSTPQGRSEVSGTPGEGGPEGLAATSTNRVRVQLQQGHNHIDSVPISKGSPITVQEGQDAVDTLITRQSGRLRSDCSSAGNRMKRTIAGYPPNGVPCPPACGNIARKRCGGRNREVRLDLENNAGTNFQR